jgi:Flp pilus assembly protein TadG
MIGILARTRRFAGRLARSTRALGAVEFALTAPFLILMYVGSYQLMDAISAYRKVTITARSLADLATLNETTTQDKMQAILNAARQVMTPYSTADSSLAIAQIAIDHDDNASLVWACTNTDSPVCSTSSSAIKLSDITIPADLKNPDTYLIYSRIIFHYKPTVAGTLIGPLTFSDDIFMNPRQSPSICLNIGTNPDGSTKCMGQEES